MPQRVEVGIGDLLNVTARLKPRDDRTLARIAHLLGIQDLPLSPGRPKPEDGEATLAEPVIGNRDKPVPEIRAGGTIRLSPRNASVERAPDADLTFDVETERGIAMPDLQAFDRRWRPAPLPERLRHPAQVPALLRDVAVTDSNDGAIDLNATVERLASGADPFPLPRHRRPTLRRGGQVLIDISDAIMPFLREAMELAQKIPVTLGPAFSTWRCAGPPDVSAVIGPGRVQTYEFPPSGTPIILIGGWAGEHLSGNGRDWKRFATAAGERGCPLHVLSPIANASFRHPGASRTLRWEPPAKTAAGLESHARRIDAPCEDWAAVELWRQSPDAFRLAVLASLATRVEPFLLRRLRRTFLPGATARDEALFWASSVVEARTPDVVEFTDEAQAALCGILARHRDLFKKVKDAVGEAHSEHPELMRIEEELRFRSLRSSDPDGAWIDQTLSMIAQLGRPNSAGLASWTLRVLTTTPGRLQASPLRNDLVQRAAQALNRKVDQAPLIGVAVAWTGKHRGKLLVKRADPEDAETVIQVPDISPIILEVEYGHLGRLRQKRRLTVTDEWTGRDMPPGPVLIRSSTGTAWRVHTADKTADAWIFHYVDDEDEASQLAGRLRELGVRVHALDTIGPKRTFRQSWGKPIMVISPRGMRRHSPFPMPPEASVVSFAVTARQMTEDLRPLWLADMALPNDAVEHVMEELRRRSAGGSLHTASIRSGSLELSDERPWYEQVPPRSASINRPPIGTRAPVHFRPTITEASHPIRPPLAELFKRVDLEGGPIEVIARDSRMATAAASFLAFNNALQRRYCDGIYYILSGTGDPKSILMSVATRMGIAAEPADAADYAAALLKRGRCLLLIDGAPLLYDFTGPLGCSVSFVSHDDKARNVFTTIEVGDGAYVELCYAPSDLPTARGVAVQLQKMNVGVRMCPVFADGGLENWDDFRAPVLILTRRTSEAERSRLSYLAHHLDRSKSTILVRGEGVEYADIHPYPKVILAGPGRDDARIWLRKLVTFAQQSREK